MKTLLLMRHAHAGAKKPGQSDFDRPLDPLGRRAAAAMGRVLLRENLMPEFIVSSAASRAEETARLVAENCPASPPVECSPELYSAAPEGYLQTLREACGPQSTVLLVGHNPTMETLVAKFTGRCQPLAPAALAHFCLDLSHWRHLHLNCPAELLHLWLADLTS